MDQSANKLALVEPSNFNFNTETFDTNVFQNDVQFNKLKIFEEFDNFISTLDKNKILGLLMSFSLLFLPPAIFPGFAGKLFPLTYGIFIIYLFFTYGLNMFRNWKNNAGL